MKHLWTLVAGLTFAVGIALCSGAYTIWHSYAQFAAQATPVDGTVSAISPLGAGNTTAATPIVQFKTQDGSIVHVSLPGRKAYAAGDHVSVLYDALRPGQTRIDDAAETWTRTLWLAAPGVPLVLIGGALFIGQLRQRRQSTRSVN